MPDRRRTLVQTYGRHRQRVVSMDVFASSGEKHLFSSFSSNDSTNTDQSLEASRNRRTKDNVFKDAEKENCVPTRKTYTRKPRAAKQKNPKIFSSDSSFNSQHDNSSTTKPKALADNNHKIKPGTTTNTRRKTQASRKQRTVPPKYTTLASNTSTDSSAQNSKLNFSDFEKYSLVISESPPLEGNVGTPPLNIGSHIKAKGVFSSTPNMQTTSTPHMNTPKQHASKRPKRNLHKEVLSKGMTTRKQTRKQARNRNQKSDMSCLDHSGIINVDDSVDDKGQEESLYMEKSMIAELKPMENLQTSNVGNLSALPCSPVPCIDESMESSPVGNFHIKDHGDTHMEIPHTKYNDSSLMEISQSKDNEHVTSPKCASPRKSLINSRNISPQEHTPSRNDKHENSRLDVRLLDQCEVQLSKMSILQETYIVDDEGHAIPKSCVKRKPANKIPHSSEESPPEFDGSRSLFETSEVPVHVTTTRRRKDKHGTGSSQSGTSSSSTAEEYIEVSDSEESADEEEVFMEYVTTSDSDVESDTSDDDYHDDRLLSDICEDEEGSEVEYSEEEEEEDDFVEELSSERDSRDVTRYTLAENSTDCVPAGSVENSIIDRTENSIADCRENSTSDATENYTFDRTEYSIADRTENSTSDATENYTFDRTENSIADRTENCTSDATENYTFDRTENSIADRTENSTSDATENYTDDQTENSTVDHTKNSTVDHTENSFVDLTENSTSNTTVNSSLDNSKNSKYEISIEQSISSSQESENNIPTRQLRTRNNITDVQSKIESGNNEPGSETEIYSIENGENISDSDSEIHSVNKDSQLDTESEISTQRDNSSDSQISSSAYFSSNSHLASQECSKRMSIVSCSRRNIHESVSDDPMETSQENQESTYGDSKGGDNEDESDENEDEGDTNEDDGSDDAGNEDDGNLENDEEMNDRLDELYVPINKDVEPVTPINKKKRLSLLETLTPIKRRDSVKSPKQRVLELCNQTQTVPFSKFFTPAMYKKCVKIGEGVYGEVFKTERSKTSVAVKVIPIEGDFPVNDEPQKTFEEIIPEIVISKELSDLRDCEDNETSSFVQVRRVNVVQGRYPDQLLRQWDNYHKRKISENDRPDIFTPSQLFLVFEFEECGCDLEGFEFTTQYQALSVLLQVTSALATAEEAFQFEHRDLHWGNILVKQTTDEVVSYQINGEEYYIESHGVKVAVIDFTLSRLSQDGCSVYCDLSTDPTIFEGHGDYQFDIYRKMKEENQNNWRKFNPYTNVLWIHYLVDKLIKCIRYPPKATRDETLVMRQLRAFSRETLEYSSARHLLSECPLFVDHITS